jgi:hypothetical protein
LFEEQVQKTPDAYEMSLIEPHGGRLIDREASGAERKSLLWASKHMPELTVNAREGPTLN